MLKRSELAALRDACLHTEFRDHLTALLERWPEGHVLVPAEPTGYMRACGLSALYSAQSFAPAELSQTFPASSCYLAMVAAAQEEQR
jgi:hypothetical protein